MDPIKFAVLVAYIVKRCSLDDGSNYLSSFDISDLHRMVADCVQPAVVQVEDYDGRLGKAEVARKVQAMLNHMSYGRKLDAIKSHRELTGWGLKESKDAIEASLESRSYYHPGLED